ncbi:MAG TPA: translocation/assembly module TamB domain-containing protein, partial [Gammaproteobacteria bacterium]|nr:translocation/assembly module TamB domain-containing protein [Gammaproteobacteria bacterium]
GQLHVQRLSLAQVDYAPAGTEADSRSAESQPSKVSLPLAIQIDEVSVEDALVRRDGSRNRIDRVLVQGFSVNGNIVTLTHLEVAADELELSAHGHVDPAPPHAVEAGIVWSYRLPDGARAEGIGNASGDLHALRIEHKLIQPFPVDVAGTVSPLAEPLRMDLTGQWKSLRWPLAGKPEFSSQSGAFGARGTLDQLALSLDASIDAEAIPARGLNIDADMKRLEKKLEASLGWTVRMADGSQAVGRGTFEWDGARIDIDHAMEKPLRISTRGHVALAGAASEVSLDGEWRDLVWPLTGEPTFTSDSGRYRVTGILNALEFQMNAAMRSEAAQIAHMDLALEGEASAAAPFPFDAALSFTAGLAQEIEAMGRARIKGDASRIEVETSVQRPVALKARGSIALSSTPPEINLSGEWQDLRWPLSGNVEVESAEGRFFVSGPKERLALRLEAEGSGPRMPPADIRLQARVRPESALIDSFSVKTLGGEIRAAGDVGWQPAPRWSLEVSASGLRPERYLSEWPGEISFETAVSGRMDVGGPRITLDPLKLDGRLRGQPVEARGAVSVDGTRISARKLRLRSGDNRVDINGDAGERLNLGFVIDAPALNTVAPNLAGSLEGEGRLAGTRSRPLVTAKLSGRNLAWRDNRATAISVDVNAGLAPGHRSKIALEASGIRAGSNLLDKASLSGDGTPEQHRLTLNVSAPADSLYIQANGRYQAGDWSGSVDSVLKSERFGEWRTSRPAAMSASGDRVRLQDLCLVRAPARVCAAASWRTEGDVIEASGEIASLPLEFSRPFLPQDLRVEGLLSGDFKAGGTLGAPQAAARISADSGRISYQPGAGFEGGQFNYRNARVDLSYAPSGARLQMGLELEDAGSMRGSLETGALRDDGPAPLKGRVEADFSDLEWIGVVVPQLVDVRGRLNAALEIGGTTAKPAVAGELALRNGQANVPDLGLELRQMVVAMRSDKSDRVVLEGALSSGGGRMEITGRSAISQTGDRRVDLELKGRDFELAKLPTVHAYVSPDLRLSVNPKLAEVTGGVHIPRASVKLKELPQSAVKVSEDEVIVNARQEDQRQKKRLGPPLRIKVEMSLGDEVNFEGFGLSTHIDGSLAVSGESGQPPQAQGTLSLREGRYQAYGQDLKIQTGRLLFAGPIDNPGIDVTAVRELKDVTAGIVITGNVKSVDSRVFSDPSLPEAEAFSYLLTGRPLSGGAQTDAAKLQQAAAALGLKRANVITQQIQNMLGLDQLTVGGDGVDQTSLLLGKQITPDIFIRYALGIFEESGKLLLDYRLTDSISVQAESGEQQGVDLIYKIEREKLF